VTPSDFSEDRLVEKPTLELLERIGYEIVDGFNERLGPEGLGRDDESQVTLHHRLRSKLAQLNPDLSAAAIELAIEELMIDRSVMDPVRASQVFWNLLRDGVKVTLTDDDGAPVTETVVLVDWRSPERNEFLAVSQFWVVGPLHKRRCDIVCFVNGIPLVLFELKASHKSLKSAYSENLTDYRDAIPQLFTPNAIVILSNGSETRVGSTFASWEWFGEWKRIGSESEPGVVSLETAIHGLCEPPRLLDTAENFVAYLERPGGLIKVLAQNHQVLGVNAAIRALRERSIHQGRLGVFWHSQGSGKSLSMLLFTQKVLRREPGNWTFVMVTDRIELDDQLYGEFKDAGVVDGHLQATSSTHLQQLLAEDHRYVFTRIQKFRPGEGRDEMSVCSDRDDIIVITDEAHRSQYLTLARNMREALPNAGFLGFTGTPLITTELERTREVFGDYVSTYNFRESIEDGATVPLFYESRIPELQITNERFDEEFTEILDGAELDESQEQALTRRFATEYQLIARPERLQRIAADLVRHFVGRGFLGKAMVVSIDKETAVRMYDLVSREWALHLAELEERAVLLPELEREGLDAQIAFMRETDMAVVISQSQNEIARMREVGLDIAPHRKRMKEEDLGERFKDSSDPFRLVFVCAMWMTGFDVPSCSTIYIDRPMRNHTLMQTIARANRVFPEKESGLIVDYVGVFRHLEDALAIYASDLRGRGSEVIRAKSALIAELDEAVGELVEYCTRWDVDLEALSRAEGFEFIALRDASVEALLIEDMTRRLYLEYSDRVRQLFAAVLPDPAAGAHARLVGVARNLAAKVRSLDQVPDIGGVTGAVRDLLDRSVGAEDYVIRAAAAGAEADRFIDLNSIDFDALAAALVGRKHSSTRRLIGDLTSRAEAAAARNPTRGSLVEELRELIDSYNAGSLDVDEMLHRLQELSGRLMEEEERTEREGLTEPELAVFDLLTRPDPALTDLERDEVKGIARRLMSEIGERLVLDWRKKVRTREAARALVKEVLDALPDAYDPDTWARKVDIVFNHIFASYYDDGGSVYAEAGDGAAAPAISAGSVDVEVDTVTPAIIELIESNPEIAEKVAENLRGRDAFFAVPSAQLIAADESFEVEFKSTARWNLQEKCKDKHMEDAIVKTVAGFLNTDGGSLFIGVADDRSPIGLDPDLQLVKPATVDGLVNWLTTHLANTLQRLAVMKTRTRIESIDGVEICRIDVARSSTPVRARMSDKSEAFWVRMNNSTRRLSELEVEEYVDDHWTSPRSGPDS
jgi:type I restriction enzyme, R subunit